MQTQNNAMRPEFAATLAIGEWDKFDSVEVHPVHEDEEGNCEICDAEDAHFWSVYGHFRTGGLECFVDVDTEEEAIRVAAEVENLIRKAGTLEFVRFTHNGTTNYYHCDCGAAWMIETCCECGDACPECDTICAPTSSHHEHACTNPDCDLGSIGKPT